MRVAICSDVVNERKHLERLLERESDSRLSTTGIFYIDSFGNEESLYESPLTYDLYIVNFQEGSTKNRQFAHELRKLAISSPIALVSSEIIQLENTDFEILLQPISTEALSRLINLALEHHKSAPSGIELRSEDRTYYINPDEIVYTKKDTNGVLVVLTEKRTLRVQTSLNMLYSYLEVYPFFFTSTATVVVNAKHIVCVSHNKITMDNDECLNLSFFMRKTASLLYGQFGVHRLN